MDLMNLWNIIIGWDRWDVVDSISSFVVALGIIIALWQVRMLKGQIRLTAFNSVLEHWGGEEEREARRYVVSNDFEFGEKDGLDYLRDDHRKKVEAVLALCDRTSFLALKAKTEKDIVEFVGLPMFQIWKKTENFIKARRKRESKTEERKPGTYMYHFEELIEKNRRELENMSPLKEKQVTKQEPQKEV